MDVDELMARLERATREYRAAHAAVQEHGAAVVKAARQQLGMTQRELAERLGVDHSYVSKIENGHIRPGRPFLAALAVVLARRKQEEEVGARG
jgi:ribosome-binding protein aMBF1 (putative translation factor)